MSDGVIKTIITLDEDQFSGRYSNAAKVDIIKKMGQHQQNMWMSELWYRHYWIVRKVKFSIIELVHCLKDSMMG